MVEANLFIVVTSRCNLSCGYCITSVCQTPKIDMPISTIEKIKTYIDDNDISIRKSVCITGGEPTVLGNEYILNVKNILCTGDTKLAILTNGVKPLDELLDNDIITKVTMHPVMYPIGTAEYIQTLDNVKRHVNKYNFVLNHMIFERGMDPLPAIQIMVDECGPRSISSAHIRFIDHDPEATILRMNEDDIEYFNDITKKYDIVRKYLVDNHIPNVVLNPPDDQLVPSWVDPYDAEAIMINLDETLYPGSVYTTRHISDKMKTNLSYGTLDTDFDASRYASILNKYIRIPYTRCYGIEDGDIDCVSCEHTATCLKDRIVTYNDDTDELGSINIPSAAMFSYRLNMINGD